MSLHGALVAAARMTLWLSALPTGMRQAYLRSSSSKSKLTPSHRGDISGHWSEVFLGKLPDDAVLYRSLFGGPPEGSNGGTQNTNGLNDL